MSALRTGVNILFWLSLGVLITMFVIFSFSGIAIQQELGSEARDTFIPFTVLAWMYSVDTPVVFPITVTLTILAAGSALFARLYPGFKSTSLSPASVVPVTNVPTNAAKVGGGRRR